MLQRSFTIDPASHDVVQSEHSWMGIVLQFNLQLCVACLVMSAGWWFDFFPVKLAGVAMLCGVILGFIGERDKQRTLQDAYIKHLEARTARLLPRQPTAAQPEPTQPNDGGETPTTEFLEAVWAHAHARGEFPDVRSDVFKPLSLSKTRAGKMFVRMTTWGAVEGRQEGGAAGKPREGWSLARCLHQVYVEAPELLTLRVWG